MKKVSKRIISLLTAIIVCITIMPFASADSNSNSNSANMLMPPQTMEAYLTDDNGKVSITNGELISYNVVNISNNLSDVSATYKFDLCSNGDEIKAISKSSSTQTVSGVDGGCSSHVYLVIYYYYRDIPAEYLLYRVAGHWIISDSKVSVKSASLDYGCTGKGSSGSTAQTTYNVSVNNHFSVNTGYNHYVYNNAIGTLGATLNMVYQMGSSRTWTYTLTNNLF